MSGTVDTRTVEMRFDNSDFESNVKQSMSTLEKLKKALKLDGASTGLKEVEKASRKLDFRDFKGSIDSVGKRFSVLETIATGALLKIGASAAEAGMRIAKSLTIDQIAAGWDKYAEKTTAVQTIMANIVDEEGQFVDEAAKMQYVNRYLNKLLWFSDETSYNFTDMTSNVGKFIANGQGLEDSVTAMQGIATWAAMSGQNAQTASRAMYNISQALGTGSMKIRDWMSIENANMATAQFKALAIEVGLDKNKIKEGQVTVENFRESLSGKDTNGWFDKDVMMEVFNRYGEAATKFEEHWEATGQTATDAIREIRQGNKDLADEIGIDIDSVGFKAFAAAQEAKTFGEVVAATADAVSTKWMRIFENIFGDYLQAKDLWTDLSNDLWEIFAGPLDVLGDIMDKWNQGFFKDGPQNIIQKWFASGQLDDLENGLNYVSKAAAQTAKNTEKVTYRIEALEDGSQQLVKLVETAPGVYTRFTKKIYDADKDLLSGRDLLIDGFRNILRTFIFDWEETNNEGKVIEHKSIFTTIKDAIKEVIFGTSDMEEIIPRVAGKMWELTKRFSDFTKKMLPTEKTLSKIKNAFKGVFTLLKIGGKFVKAIAKPFADLFGKIFKNAPSNILNLADSIGSWIQALDKYLDENKVFEKVSNKISKGLQTLSTWVNNLSVSLTGLSVKDLGKKLRDDVFGFFENHDFKGTFESVITYFKGIFQQIQNVNGEELPEKLTPLQNFWLGLKNIFNAMKQFFSLVSPIFRGIGEFLSNVFTSISDAFSKNKKTDAGVEKFRSLWDALREIFSGIGDFFASVGPTLNKIGGWIGNFFRTLGEGIAEWAKDKSPEEIVGSLLKGGFVVSLTNLINSIAKLARGGKIGSSIAKGLDAVKGVLKAYSREINASAIAEIGLAIALFAGSMWILDQIPADHMQKIGQVLMNLAVAVSLFAIAINAFKRKKNLGESLSGSGGLLDGLKAIMTATVGSSIFANDATAKFVKITLGILLAAIAAKKIIDAIGGMGDMIVKLSEIPPSQLEKGGKVAAQILAAFGIFSLFAGFSNKATSTLFAALGAYVLVKAIGKLANLMADLGSNDAKMNNIQKVVDKFGYVFEAVKSMALWAIKIAAVLTVAELALAAFSTGKLTNTVGMSKVMKQFGKNFLRVAAALLVVTVALGLMGNITKNMEPGDFDKISAFFQSLIVWFSIFQSISIGILSFGTSGISDVAAVMKQFGKNFLRVAASLAIVAIAFGAMALVSKMLTPGELAGIAVIFGVFLGAVSILSLVALKAASLKKSEYITKNMKAIGDMFLKVAASLAIVAAAFTIMDNLSMTPDRMKGVSAIFGVFTLIVAAFSLLAINNATMKKAEYFAKNMKAMSVLFLSVSASFFIVAAAFAIMSSLNLETTEMWNIAGVFGAFTGVVAVMAILGALIGKIGKWEAIQGIGAIALEMVATAVSIGIVAAAFALLASVATPEQMSQAVEIIKWFGIIVGALAIIGTIAGAIPGAFVGLLGVAALILSIGAACLLAGVGIGVAVVAFGLFADGLANLVSSIAKDGPEFAANIDAVMKSVLEAVINNAPLFEEAGSAVISALASGVARAVKTVGKWIKETSSSLWNSIVESFSYEIDEHGFRVEPEGNPAAAEETGAEDADAYIAGYEQQMAQLQSKVNTSESVSSDAKASSQFGKEAGEKDASAYGESYVNQLMSGFAGVNLADLNLGNVTGGVANFAEMFGISGIDVSSMSSMLSGAFGEIDLTSLWSGKSSELITAIQTTTASDVSPAADEMASAIAEPISSLDASGWGAEIGSGLASGLRSEIPTVEAAASDLAAAVSKYIHFSEPDAGPLSDFHTYAPDMIRLWCKGVKDNLGMVENSSYGVADTVYDGFSTALDYVSDLIDNGMSDQLTIRPVMDLTEIQNGMNSMTSMLSSNSGYTITGTTKLAGTAAYGMRTVNAAPTEAQTMQTDIGPTSNNFYITNSDPNAVAEKVSKILNNQTRRQKAVWAYR